MSAKSAYPGIVNAENGSSQAPKNIPDPKRLVTSKGLSNLKTPLVLGVESTCDETGFALVHGNQLVANKVATSMEQHARYGGIIPEIASRAHLEAFIPTLTAMIEESGHSLADVDAIAVSAGPGLVGSLTVGICGAKALAQALGLPLYGVNHVIGHLAVDELVDGALPKRFIGLVASGGHSNLLLVEDLARDIRELGGTLDDAAGEAFDKVGRLLGLPYPGGPHVDRLSQQWHQSANIVGDAGNAEVSNSCTSDEGNANVNNSGTGDTGTNGQGSAKAISTNDAGGANASSTNGTGGASANNTNTGGFEVIQHNHKSPSKPLVFPRGLAAGTPEQRAKHRYNFSFSGLKTAVLRHLEQHPPTAASIPEVCAAFSESINDSLTAKTVQAALDFECHTIVVGGGFTANSRFRELLLERAEQAGLEVRIPPLKFCTDNGAQIAALGAVLLAAGVSPSPANFGPDSSMELTQVIA